MAYATAQDMIDRFGEREVTALADRDNNGLSEQDVLSSALNAAANEIDPYLMGLYTLPLNPVPVIVRDFSCDVARYRLCGAAVTTTDEIRERYKDAIRFFEKVSKSEIKLGLSDDQQTTTVSGGVKVSAPGRIFNDIQGYR